MTVNTEKPTNVVYSEQVGERLRAERKRLGLNQAELAAVASVTKNTQGAYELGDRTPGIDYLEAVRGAGVDIGFVLWGERLIASLEPDANELLDDWRRLAAQEREAVCGMVRTFAGRDSDPAYLASPRPAYGAPPSATLPSEAALEAAFAGLLTASARMERDELAHELARRLPMLLEIAGDALPSEESATGDASPAPPAARPVARREGRRGPRR